MTKAEFLAKVEGRIRPVLTFLPPEILTAIYSPARKMFVSMLANEVLQNPIRLSTDEEKILWGIKFRCGLFNAAGIFKHGEGYNTVASQGAGAYLAGTSTCNQRRGNQKLGIMHPFMPYPKTNSASNWMGLPNDGHEILAKKISNIEKIEGCPVGVSIASDPEVSDDEAVKGIVEGLKMFERAGADFIELNESCPNVPHKAMSNSSLDDGLIIRLQRIYESYLKYRGRNLPVIVKFSIDTNKNLLNELIDLLLTLGFDGINIGNTSTEYQRYRPFINESDLKSFDYFTSNYGGGISGRLLKDKSFELASYASEYIKTKNLNKEFHVIRTGGIDSITDIRKSELAGISLNQWFTGYFENFARHGHGLYKKLF